MTTANASPRGHRYPQALAYVKAHGAILAVGVTLLLAGIGATWHVTNRVHDGDLGVRQEVRHSEETLREEIGALREELHEDIGALREEVHEDIGALREEVHEDIGALREELHEQIGELRTEVRANYRDLRDRIGESSCEEIWLGQPLAGYSDSYWVFRQ